MVAHTVTSRPEEKQVSKALLTSGAEDPKVLPVTKPRAGPPEREARDPSRYRVVLSCAFDSHKT